MKRIAYFSTALLLLASCSKGGEEWTLNGELSTDASTVILEMPSAVGGWYEADSAKVDNGHFTLTRPRANSEIYRLKVNGQYIYLPADSTETLSLVINTDGRYIIEGSDEAKLFSAVNEVIDSPADATTNRKLLKALENNFGSTAAYYALLRTDWKNKTLLRAVANAYSNQKSDDTRTQLLLRKMKEVTSSASSGETVIIEAPELGYFDIELMNRRGEMVALSSVVETHPLTLLAFVNMADESGAAVNMLIGESLTEHPQLGVYEVGFGNNQHLWANTTEQLPWVNVYQSESASQTHLGQYQLTQIPTFFLIKDGEIIERIASPLDIQSTINKHI